MVSGEFHTRRAVPGDAEAIAVAHLDSIRSIGPKFYPRNVVEAWSAEITPEIYVKAVRVHAKDTYEAMIGV